MSEQTEVVEALDNGITYNLETEEGLSEILKHPKVSAELDRRNSKSFERFKIETLTNYVEKTRIEELEQEYISQLNNVKIENEIDKILTGTKHSELLKSQMDKSSLSLVDGKVVGLEEQVNLLKEKYSDLFTTTKTTPPAPKSTDKLELSKADFAKMSVAQKTKLYLEDRETYNKMTEV
ncbi:MAG: phage scaffolding protein [Cetobacterium sp.]